MSWASSQQKLSSGVCKQHGRSADQSAHLRRLISAFVNPLLESFISKLASTEILIF